MSTRIRRGRPISILPDISTLLESTYFPYGLDFYRYNILLNILQIPRFLPSASLTRSIRPSLPPAVLPSEAISYGNQDTPAFCADQISCLMISIFWRGQDISIFAPPTDLHPEFRHQSRRLALRYNKRHSTVRYAALRPVWAGKMGERLLHYAEGRRQQRPRLSWNASPRRARGRRSRRQIRAF